MLLAFLAGAIAKLLRLAEAAAPAARELAPEWFKFPMV
jgi:hypothetical protein